MREAHPLLSKSIQSIVGIFVGFAIGGVLGVLATPPGPAPSTPTSGFIAEVDRGPEPVAVSLTTVLGPITTRVPRDDAVLPLTPSLPEASPADRASTPKATKVTSTKASRASTPAKKAAPKPKPAPAPRSTPPPPPAAEPPPPAVEESPPPPAPKAEKPKGSKPKPDKPPKPPKPPK